MKRLLIILSLLLWFGCEEESDESTDLNLITATFQNGYCDPNVTSFLIISDEDGDILADTSFQGDVSFSLSAGSGVTVPEKIDITLISRDEYDRFWVQTNPGIDRGVDWTWDNPYFEPEIVNTSSYRFSNISENNISRVVLSSSGFYSRNTVNESTIYTLSHYNEIDDVCVIAYKEDGSAFYTVLEDVDGYEVDNIDLSLLAPATNKVITNSTGEVCDNINLYGYGEDESFISYYRHRFTDRGYLESGGWSENQDFFVNYPSEFSKFATHITVGQYYVIGEKDWFQRTFGDIPDNVEKINADISVLKSDPLDFEVTTTGVYDQWSVHFQDTLSGGDWSFYINPNISSGSIPTLPSHVYDEYPELFEASFQMKYVSATDYLCVDSHKEWVNLLFNTDGYYGDFCSGLRQVGIRVN